MGEWVGGRAGSTRAWRHRRAWWTAELVRTGGVPCARNCGYLVRPTDNWDLDHHLDDDNDANTRPSHRACNQIAGQQKAMRNGVDRSHARATERNEGGPFFGHGYPPDALSLPHTRWAGAAEDVTGMTPEDAVGVPWLAGLLPVPDDAAWPRLLSAPSPRAVGSHGGQFADWVAEHGRWPLRWWQVLVAVLLLEFDAAGKLVHRIAAVTLPRQFGKSYLLSWLAMWRITFGADLFGEPQLVVMISKDLQVAKLVQAPMRAFAREHPDVYDVRESGAETKITHRPSGSEWVLRSAEGAYGHGVGLAIVDEGWSIKPQTVDIALGPTQVERTSPQLILTSTSNEAATPLMIARRAGAVAELTDPDALTLWVEWSLPPGAPLDDMTVWQAVLPHWHQQRLDEIQRAYATALQTRSTDPTQPDPLLSVATQLGNVWPATVETAGRGEQLIDPAMWADCEDDLCPVGPLVIAVEDHAGAGAAAVAVGRTEDGRLYVQGAVFDRRSDAFGWARRIRGLYPMSRVLAGPSIVGDPEARNLHAKVPPVADTRTGLPLLRDVVAEGRLAHFLTPELGAQLAVARVTTGTAGLSLVPGPRADLVRATLWCLVAMEHNPPRSPAVHV